MSKEGYEQKYVKEAFDTNWIAPLGENVDLFEKEFAELIGTEDAAALSSGTSAIHLALKAVDVRRGDVVICQSLTFVATANPILYQGAQPVFVDSHWKTWNMDPIALREALTRYPQAKAVVIVHLYGLSAAVDELLAICHEFGVPLIEDAAESLGTLYKGKQTGIYGRFGIYSFNGNKIITTSVGGMLVSNEKQKLTKVRFWATQSRENTRHYQHQELGYNYRMSNIAAGIGRGQLRVLAQRVAEKRAIYRLYQNELSGLSEVEFMPQNDWDEPNYWLSVILLKKTNPLQLINALEKENIEARPVWKPLHLQPLFESCDYFGGRTAEELFQRGICLPSDTKLTENQLLHVTKVIKEVCTYE